MHPSHLGSDVMHSQISQYRIYVFVSAVDRGFCLDPVFHIRFLQTHKAHLSSPAESILKYLHKYML